MSASDVALRNISRRLANLERRAPGAHLASMSFIDVSAGGALNFGAEVGQMINLWGARRRKSQLNRELNDATAQNYPGVDANFGIGVQASTVYVRTSKNFAIHVGGDHNDGELDPGDTSLGGAAGTNTFYHQFTSGASTARVMDAAGNFNEIGVSAGSGAWQKSSDIMNAYHNTTNMGIVGGATQYSVSLTTTRQFGSGSWVEPVDARLTISTPRAGAIALVFVQVDAQLVAAGTGVNTVGLKVNGTYRAAQLNFGSDAVNDTVNARTMITGSWVVACPTSSSWTLQAGFTRTGTADYDALATHTKLEALVFG